MTRPRGTGSIFLRGDVYWIKFHRNGVAVRESSRSEKVKVAEKLLKTRLNEVENGTFINSKDRRVSVDELYQGLLAEYRDNGRASLVGAEQRWRTRLAKHFGGLRAVNLTTAALNSYVSWCRDQDFSAATINRDLAALRRAFYLAKAANTLRDVPHFPHLREADPRKGFVEEASFRKLLESTSELWLRALMTTAYTFGFRRSELLAMRVDQVNLLDRTITLHVGTTKSGEGRVVKMTSDVCTLLSAMIAGKSAADYVFTRPDGARVHDFRKSWRALCKAAGVPELILHDFRRSAVRNMVRRGIPERVAMTISGHKTRAVFERYNIVSESDIAEAARKIEAGQVGHSLGTIDSENGSESHVATPIGSRPN